MEYLKFGSLRDRIDPAPEIEVKLIMRQLFDGVGHLHDEGIVHRDLKPSVCRITHA